MSTTVNSKSTALRIIHGTWTHSEGTANETLVVLGYVYSGIVTNCDTTNADVGIKYSVSRDTTTNKSTITFHCSSAVTDGRFMFFVSSM